jgi:ubiquinone/menaquinone biosynthesis C-methylase UbiE
VLLARSGAFDRVAGIDPSPGMIANAIVPTPSEAPSCQVDYVVGGAEDLSRFGDAEFDLVTAGIGNAIDKVRETQS